MEQQPGPAGNPFAPPKADVADVGAGNAPVLATRGNRLLATIIDFAAQIAVMMVVNLALPFSLFSDQGPDAAPLAAGLVGIVIWFVLQGPILVKRGQTLGKVALGMRIVRPDGSRVGPARMLGLRYGVGWAVGLIPLVNVIYGLIDSLLIFRASHRCLHDQIADTIVVRL